MQLQGWLSHEDHRGVGHQLHSDGQPLALLDAQALPACKVAARRDVEDKRGTVAASHHYAGDGCPVAGAAEDPWAASRIQAPWLAACTHPRSPRCWSATRSGPPFPGSPPPAAPPARTRGSSSSSSKRVERDAGGQGTGDRAHRHKRAVEGPCGGAAACPPNHSAARCRGRWPGPRPSTHAPTHPRTCCALTSGVRRRRAENWRASRTVVPAEWLSCRGRRGCAGRGGGTVFHVRDVHSVQAGECREGFGRRGDHSARARPTMNCLLVSDSHLLLPTSAALPAACPMHPHVPFQAVPFLSRAHAQCGDPPPPPRHKAVRLPHPPTHPPAAPHSRTRATRGPAPWGGLPGGGGVGVGDTSWWAGLCSAGASS